MHSVAAASRLIAACRTPADFVTIIAELGFESAIPQLTSRQVEALGLNQMLTDTRIAVGPGSLRALLFSLDDKADIREAIRATASRLRSRAPQFLWLVCVVQPSRQLFAVAAAEGGRTRARAAALVVDQANIVDSDCETLCALRGARSPVDALCHSRWIEILGRESVNRRFFRELERLVAHLASSLDPLPGAADAAELALLYASRLIFLCFLEAKGWLNNDRGFLGNSFADCMLSGGRFHGRVLRPLFFGTLNTRPAKRSPRAREFGRVPFLNGGLFARTPVEIRCGASVFSDESIGDFFGDLLTKFRFTAREDAATWSEAAIDPEMLGKAFESLMSSDNRKATGAFYTPQALVREVTRGAIHHALDGIEGENVNRVAARLRVLDPACGSGAFLVHALEEIAAIRASSGDERPIHLIRRDVLTRSIFGVDINPVAVWLCELRLWLSMAIDDPETDPLRVSPLPNLDRNVRIGDSLTGGSFCDAEVGFANRRITTTRQRYTRATGNRKRALGRSLDSLERKSAIDYLNHRLLKLSHERREIVIIARSRDLFGNRFQSRHSRIRLDELRMLIRESRVQLKSLKTGGALPFSYATHFSDAGQRGGFDVVIGNPPWIRSHNLPREIRELLHSRFTVYRRAGWRVGREAAGAGKGFASQVDAAALFIEQSIAVARNGGILSLIVPSKLWRSLAGGGVRQLIDERTCLLELHDLSHARQEFDASVYPSVILARRDDERNANPRCIAVQSHSADAVKRFAIKGDSLPFDSTDGSPWVIVPPDVRRAFDRLRESGPILAESHFSRPLLGVKTGCNAAYLLTQDEADEAGIESAMLRRALRGDSIRRGRVESSDDLILYPHNDAGPLARLPPNAAMWLNRWRRELERRSDLHATDKWWRLFRTESASSNSHRVVWADIGRRTRVAILEKGDASVPLNTCYVIPTSSREDARALAAILSSALANAWLGIIAEPVRGGYRRFFGWTMAMLPIPRDWSRALSILATVRFENASDDDLDSAVTEAYGCCKKDVEELLQWEA